jgi:hypothetical protein
VLLGGECLAAHRRGEQSDEAAAGATLEASFMLHVIALVEGLSKK